MKRLGHDAVDTLSGSEALGHDKLADMVSYVA